MKNEKIENVTLTIYYTQPGLLTDIPLNIENLLRLKSTNKVTVRGTELGEHINFFNKINEETLMCVRKKSKCLDARLYYVFENMEKQKLYEVAMWGVGGEKNSMFVNGVEVKEASILYEVIMPFLPQDIKEHLQGF